jgi:Domain of unknown function (DUF4129)
LAIWLGVAGPGIGRRAAQRLARRELARAIYQPPLTQRILGAIGRFLNTLVSGASAAFPGGWWALVVLIALAVLAAALIIFWVRPSRTAVMPAALLAGARRSAAEHRRAAERLAAAGDYTGAIIECLRAVAVGLEERDVLPPRAGRTADELAAEAATVLPGQAAELAAAASLFDDVRYGGRAGTLAGYQRLRDLDARVAAARVAGQPREPTPAAAGPPT